MQKEVELTDSSRELASVGRIIRNSDQVKGQNVLIGFGKCFDVDSSGPFFFELLSIVRNRIHRLEHFAMNVNDPELDAGLRDEVVIATQAFAQLFAPKQLVTAWDSARVTYLPDANLKTLIWFGQTAKRHQPLRVVDEAERLELIVKIDEVLRDVKEDFSIPDWMKAPLADGLTRLRTILHFFKFFGHEMAIEELLIFNQKIEALRETQGAGSFLADVQLPNLSKILGITALVGTLFMLPDQAITAYDRYVGWQQRMIALVTQPPAERRLLAPPLAALPSPTSIVKRNGSN